MLKTSLLIVFVASIVLESCSKVPITGRKQLHLLPESQMVSMGFASYNSFLKENPPLPATDHNAEMVKRIGNNLSTSVIKFLYQKKLSSRDTGYTS